MIKIEKTSFMGSGYKPQQVAKRIPADKAQRKSKSKGSVNTNPSKEDCLGWYNAKTGLWEFKWDKNV